MRLSYIFLFIFPVLLLSCKDQPVEEILSKYPDGSPHVVKYYLINNLNQKVYVKETDYYPGSIKKIEGELKDGYKYGKWCYWFTNGNKWSEGNFKYGLSNGRFHVWREDGSRNFIASYKFGKPDGLWIFWDNGGRIYKEIYIKNNKKIKELSY